MAAGEPSTTLAQSIEQAPGRAFDQLEEHPAQALAEAQRVLQSSPLIEELRVKKDNLRRVALRKAQSTKVADLPPFKFRQLLRASPRGRRWMARARTRTSLTAHRYVARLIGYREPFSTSRRASVDVFSGLKSLRSYRKSIFMMSNV